MQDDATPVPRRRRRAVRRAAGPPGPRVAVSADADSPAGDPQHVKVAPEHADTVTETAADTEAAAGMLVDAPSDPAPAGPAHAHPHVPGPGHGHPPGREPTPQHPAGTGEPQRRSGRSAARGCGRAIAALARHDPVQPGVPRCGDAGQGGRSAQRRRSRGGGGRGDDCPAALRTADRTDRRTPAGPPSAPARRRRPVALGSRVRSALWNQPAAVHRRHESATGLSPSPSCGLV